MPVSYTPRGFAIYAEFRDSYGNNIRVQQSHDAGVDAVWIFALRDGEETGPSTSPHLTVEQAILVRAALTEFIQEATEEGSTP